MEADLPLAVGLLLVHIGVAGGGLGAVLEGEGVCRRQGRRVGGSDGRLGAAGNLLLSVPGCVSGLSHVQPRQQLHARQPPAGAEQLGHVSGATALRRHVQAEQSRHSQTPLSMAVMALMKRMSRWLITPLGPFFRKASKLRGRSKGTLVSEGWCGRGEVLCVCGGGGGEGGATHVSSRPCGRMNEAAAGRHSLGLDLGGGVLGAVLNGGQQHGVGGVQGQHLVGAACSHGKHARDEQRKRQAAGWGPWHVVVWHHEVGGGDWAGRAGTGC